MVLKPVKVSTFINESVLQTEVSETQTQLATISTQITNLETQIADLKKQKTIIEVNIRDAGNLQEIISRLKLRETEGIK